ncbi:MAG: NTP transferase domain-containing protein [Elusimicrobia bacterium]|nr:NTP transferase domain-containing protein [Elusimicrobiota bacterium]
MTPKVCILTAGKGSRMGPYASYINKGLLPVDKKAVLSHIIGKFPPDTEFVVATGYLGGQVRDYLAVAHPSARIAFAEVDNFDGPGSGPGYSLLCCKDLLRGPFYFVSCDTLWDGPLPSDLEHNWMGTARVEEAASASYCNFRVRDGLVVSIHDKVRVQGGDGRAFTGLCLIRDCGAFWEGLGSGKLVSGEHQVSCGIQAILAKSPVRHYDIDWLDAGTFENYKEAVGRYEDYDFSKTNEFLYICGGSVVKFFADRSIVEKRVAKTKLNPAIFPAIDSVRGQFYGYSFLPGRTLYEENSSGIFGNLLRWLDRELWLPRTVDAGEMRGTCRDFYYEKTLKRLAGYHRKYEGSDVAGVINGVPVPAVSELLGRVPWEDLYSGTPVFMHGDLQFDNILHTGGGKFVLLDWRQDFGGRVEFGDLYYDLAKLYGGIVLNYDLIKKKLISYSEDGETIDFDFAQRHSSAGYLGTLLRFAAGKGWDVRKVRTLVPLIYLNMACLHHYPFDKMLYAFGRLLLAEELERSGKAG